MRAEPPFKPGEAVEFLSSLGIWLPAIVDRTMSVLHRKKRCIRLNVGNGVFIVRDVAKVRPSMKLSYGELNCLLVECPSTETRFKHFKSGHVYVVVGRAILEATQEPAVLYREESVVNAPTMVRPLKSWCETVDGVPRFREMLT